MPEADQSKKEKNFYLDTPQKSGTFFLKGLNAYDWGMQNRLSNIFNPKSGKTVMLAFDHGYFQGATTGLERIDITILPLIEYTDTLMLTRGILRSIIPSTYTNGIVLRASGGPSILKELSNEQIALDIEEAIRLNASAMAVQVFVGGEYETQSIYNMTRLVDMGNKYGIATLGVTAVGKELTRDAKYMRLATRMLAELGATYVKTYYVEEDFDTVVASCPVPIVIAGGKKIPEKEALVMAYNAIQDGAAGVDMGRNIFQSSAPIAMIKAVREVVHNSLKPEKAYEMFLDLKKEN
jgi:putative autoinducer-2 (AI-2) aldolase